jgi:hypothetical protein
MTTSSTTSSTGTSSTSSTTTGSTGAGTRPVARSEVRQSLDGRWPLAGAVAAVSAGAFALFSSTLLDDEVAAQGSGAVYEAIADSGTVFHVGIVTGFTAVVALAVFGAGFLRFLAARAPQGSLAEPVARLGLGATVATVAVAAALKAIVRGGLPSHVDHGMYTQESVATLQILVDQFQYAAFWGMTLVMGAVAVLSLAHRVLPRWYGALCALFTVFVVLMTGVLGLPYSAGLVTPLFLVATTVVLLRLRSRLA